MTAEAYFLIPARSGSKGIPNKNVQRVKGETLIQLAINSALESDLGFPIYVSSDSAAYFTELQGGAHKHLRSRGASLDSSSAEEVVEDFLRQIPKSSHEAAIVYLQPTSPFRTGSSIRAAWRLFQKHRRPVTSVHRDEPLHFEKFYMLGESGKIGSSVSDALSSNRQSLVRHLYPNGAIYIFSKGQFMEQGRIPVEGSQALEMGRIESWDVDVPEDLLIAQKIGEAIVQDWKGSSFEQ